MSEPLEAAKKGEELSSESHRYRRLGKTWWVIVTTLGTAAVVAAVGEIFHITPISHVEQTYYYLMLALLLPSCFVLFPASKGSPKDRVPWYDALLFIVTFLCFMVMAIVGERMIYEGWIYLGPWWNTIVGIYLWAAVLDALRRTGGTTLFIFAALVSAYPLYAIHMPGFLEGTPWGFFDAARYHLMGTESIIGIPTRIFANLVFGFIIFGTTLVAAGGGSFFLKVALALFGAVRGGTAKVCIASSGLFGMISGSVLANVITVGTVTIPAMKKSGYPSHYAAAVEAASSSGGPLLPPVMGAVAFVMASFLNVPYATIALAAIVPGVLWYLGIFVQVDGRAALAGVKGLPKSELPSLRETLKEGWIYIFGLVALVFFIFTLKQEAQAPFIASALLIAGAMLRKETRFNIKKFLNYLHDSAKSVMDMVGVLGGIGFIIGGLTMTGVALAFSSELVRAVGGNIILVLIIAALTSFILGMGMTITACYIFLAIVITPALSGFNLDILAVHLFVLYCGLWSSITPPVALASIVTAQIAGAGFFKTSLTAMRLVFTTYIVPFFFVLSPALILRGTLPDIVRTVSAATLGVVFVASSLEGFLVIMGRLNIVERVLCIVGGLLLIFPSWYANLAGITLVAVLFAIHFILHRVRSSAGAVS